MLYLSEIDGQKGIGILCDSTHPFIRYSTFKGYLGKLGRPAWAGIALYGSAQPIISGNVFESGELFRGVQVSGTSEPDIEDNTFGVNQGILVGPDAAATIRRNTITNPRPDPGASIGIVVQGSARVYANHIDHMQTGIYILGDGVTSVYDNVIEHNGGGSGSSAWWACGEGGVFIDGVTRVLQQTDLGGGGRSSGNNVFRDNEPYDVTNFSKHGSWLSTTPGPTYRDRTSIDTTSTTTTRALSSGPSASESLRYRAASGRLEARAGAVLPALSAKATRSSTRAGWSPE